MPKYRFWCYDLPIVVRSFASRFFLFAVVAACCTLPAAAATACNLTLTAGGPVSESCGAYLFTPQDFLDWGQPKVLPASGYSGFGEALASNPASQGPWYATTAYGIGVTLDPLDTIQMKRFDNTQLAWSTVTNSWIDASSVAGKTLNTFAGHFGAPSTPTSVPPYGDNLIELLPLPTGGTSDLTMLFSAPVFGVGFRVSSGRSGDFIATLQAYDGAVLLGTYVVGATGVGGVCAGLTPVGFGNPPVPCDDAPLIQFADSQGRITSVKLDVQALNDTTAFIDGLQLQTDNVPEPATSLLIGIGILSLAGLLKRGTSRASHS